MPSIGRIPWSSWVLCPALLAAVAAPVAAHAVTLTVNVAGIQSREELPSSNNQSFSYFIGAANQVLSVTYDVTLQANAPSWLSEMGVAMTNSAGSGGFYLFPAFGTNSAGTQRFTGTVQLSSLGVSLRPGSDGLLRLEFFESAGDGLAPDGVWLSGLLNIEYGAAAVVPEPGTYAMLLAGMAGLLMHRRRLHARGPR